MWVVQDGLRYGIRFANHLEVRKRELGEALSGNQKRRQQGMYKDKVTTLEDKRILAHPAEGLSSVTPRLKRLIYTRPTLWTYINMSTIYMTYRPCGRGLPRKDGKKERKERNTSWRTPR